MSSLGVVPYNASLNRTPTVEREVYGCVCVSITGALHENVQVLHVCSLSVSAHVL